MLLSEPQPTNYDLNFRLFGIPVRIHPLFWLVSIIFGWGYTQWPNGMLFLLAFVVCMFLSILVHELGHVLMSMAFGVPRHIVLYAMGGVAVGAPLTIRWQQILMLAAGPGAGFLFLAVAFALSLLISPFVEDPEVWLWVSFILNRLFFINLFWGLVNLLPIFPLDGGQMAREVFTWVAPRKGLEFTFGLSFLLAGLIALVCIASKLSENFVIVLPVEPVYTAILFGLLSFENFQRLQMEQQARRHWDWNE